MGDLIKQCVDNSCCECWKNGCGLSPLYGGCADCLEAVNPCVEQLGQLICIFGSPLAFPIIFFFPADPHTKESSGYDMSMLEAPIRRPITCCLSTACLPCAQWYVRRQVLGNDMTKYKLWQGYHDGPQCCARACPGAPITIESGTYGEENCPDAFLCMEVWCLAGACSVCCSFDVSRRYQREERGLNLDPTEARHRSCIRFFSQIMHSCFQLGACCYCAGCLVGLCAIDSGGGQQCSQEATRAGHACCRIAHIIWKGIIWTRVIAMGCMTTQMIHEASQPFTGSPKGLAIGDNDVEISDMKMPWEDESTTTTAPTTSTMHR